MAKPAFRIKPYKHPRLKFVVRSKISGKWERKFFGTKAEDQTYVEIKETELLNQGKEGATFPSWLGVMAQRENNRLRPFGKTLADAIDFYVRHLEATSRSVPVERAISELLQNRRVRSVANSTQLPPISAAPRWTISFMALRQRRRVEAHSLGALFKRIQPAIIDLGQGATLPAANRKALNCREALRPLWSQRIKRFEVIILPGRVRAGSMLSRSPFFRFVLGLSLRFRNLLERLTVSSLTTRPHEFSHLVGAC